MKRSYLSRIGKSDTAKAKKEIQALVRDIVIIRDGGCLLRNIKGIAPCNGYAGDDNHLVLQADHLVTRGKNVGYATTDLIICLCKGHHTAKTFTEKERYEDIIRGLIGKRRERLWNLAKADQKAHPYSA